MNGSVGVTVLKNERACGPIPFNLDRERKRTCDSVPVNSVKACHLVRWYDSQTRQNVNFLLIDRYCMCN